MRPTMATTPSAAAPATTWRIRSPKRTRRPEKGRRVISVVVSSVLKIPARDSYLRDDQLDMRLVPRDDPRRQRHEVVLLRVAGGRPARLARRDRPEQEGPKRTGHRMRMLLDIDVRVRRDRVRPEVLEGVRGVDDRELSVGLRSGVEQRRLCDRGKRRLDEAAVLVLDGHVLEVRRDAVPD